MALKIKINGQEYTNFQQASVVADIGAVTRGFSFASTATAQNLFPVKVNDTVEITADGIDILQGYVESLKVEYDERRHFIEVSGRSILADLVDSTVPTQTEFNGTSLIDVAKAVMAGLGLEPSVINKAGEIRAFDDITSAEIGQNAFEFLEKYSRKRQVLLTTDGGKTLTLVRAGEERAPTDLFNVLGSNFNNILNASLDINNSDRYNKYTVQSQLNPGLQGLGLTPENISDQSGEVTDNEVRSTRQLEINAEESMDSFSSGDRAKWEANIRKANALNYAATIVGHSVNGQLWLPNTLTKVTDDFAQIKADLLIRGVTYNYSLDQGSTTTLSMTRKNAFTLEVEQSQREANTEEVGDDFIL
ncbi:MAG: hypothetical protein KAS32_19175 [Candidatus Peribacteraceae bacterium]|nr:hypothetical protein [Candidatus Peribacteraceae bacterium]